MEFFNRIDPLLPIANGSFGGTHGFRMLSETSADNVVTSVLGNRLYWSMRRLQHAMHADPADIGVEPAGAGRLLRVHTETVPPLFEEMVLGRAFRRPPGIDQSTSGIAKNRVVRSKRCEQRGRIGWHRH